MSSDDDPVAELLRTGRAADALRLLAVAVRLNPRDAGAWRRTAQAFAQLNRLNEAADAYRRVIALAAATARDHHDLAMLYARVGQASAAIASFRTAVAIDPDYATAWCNLGLVLEDLNRRDEAIAALRQARRLAPGGDVGFIDYHLGALGYGPPPATCPPSYLVQLFDDYAPRFDDHLVNRLHYRGPWLLRDAVMPLLPAGAKVDVIDLGCGTGLCGEVFRPMARSIVGVDLSPRMIERARRRAVYDELVEADLVPALLRRPRGADVILAADVFIYVGNLSPLFQAATTALRPGGLFAFTLEVTDKADFTLESSRRYAHSIAYVQRLAHESALVERHVSSAVLRAGEAAPVTGAVVVLGNKQ